MSTVSQLLHFPYVTASLSPPKPLITPKPAILPLNPRKIRVQAKETRRLQSSFVVRAGDYEDEWGAEKKEPSVDGGAVAVAEADECPKEAPEITSLKKALVDSFYGTNLGLSATSETRAEIVELITQLEAKNPTPAPTEALTLLNGKWVLA